MHIQDRTDRVKDQYIFEGGWHPTPWFQRLLGNLPYRRMVFSQLSNFYVWEYSDNPG